MQQVDTKDDQIETNIVNLSTENGSDSNWKFTYDILSNAIPATFSLIFIFITETINIAFIGRYDNSELISGIGIGTLYINATGYILGIGLIGGLDTICSQTYGAKLYNLMGIYVNITRIVLVFFFFFVCLPMVIFSSPILMAIGQFERVSIIASEFCHSMTFSLFFSLQYTTSVRYLQAMNRFTPGMLITIFTALLHPLWCYIFIFYLELGVVGAGVATSFTQLLNLIIVSIYIHVKNPCPESYFYINADCFDWKLIWNYLRKGIPAALMSAADWIGFEVMTLMSSFISAESLAANICLFNFITLIFMIPMGMSFATTTLVGNSIGAKNVEKAKKYTIASVILAVSTISVTTTLIIIYRESLPHLYTNEQNVADLVAGLLKIYVCFAVIDAAGIILMGAIKGLGMQSVASFLLLFILYPVNIPMAYYFAFVLGYGVYGLWYSQFISIILMFISFLFIVLYYDWNEIAKKAEKHFMKEHRRVEDSHLYSSSSYTKHMD
jgi:MATE family multidrug resistance protein